MPPREVLDREPPVRVMAAELTEPATPVDAAGRRIPQSWPVYLWYLVCTSLQWLFGLASVVGCLAVLSAIPIVQFVSLGYLLEASARVANSGRLRDGFIDMPQFARIGSIVLGTWLMLLPLRYLSSLSLDAYLVDPGSPASGYYRVALWICTVAMISHILLAWYSGGKLRHFFWPLLAPFQGAAFFLFGGIIGPMLRPLIRWMSPKLAADLYVDRPLTAWFPPAILYAGIRRGHMYRESRDAVWNFVVGLNLPQHFWLGLRGFAGAAVWLVAPVLMLIGGSTIPNAGLAFLSGWLGALLLTVVLAHLLILQTHFACEKRFVSFFEVTRGWGLFQRAPLAWWIALTVALLASVPLYLATIELTQRELTYLISLFFVAFLYPARLLAGWAMGRSLKHHRSARPMTRMRFVLSTFLVLPATAPAILFYVFILWVSQYTAWFGPASLLVQHAFMVPVPFLGV
ncbi:MAG TPA: hypothetical protein VMP01_25930 [Pirellulaceae bacterium]|nr:hypothetical protein [Pirellulaceae bacterium]